MPTYINPAKVVVTPGGGGGGGRVIGLVIFGAVVVGAAGGVTAFINDVETLLTIILCAAFVLIVAGITYLVRQLRRGGSGIAVTAIPATHLHAARPAARPAVLPARPVPAIEPPRVITGRVIRDSVPQPRKAQP